MPAAHVLKRSKGCGDEWLMRSNQLYHSRQCRDRTAERAKPRQRTRYRRKCHGCGVMFETSHKTTRFHTQACWRLWCSAQPGYYARMWELSRKGIVPFAPPCLLG